jgi:hypothetical protein
MEGERVARGDGERERERERWQGNKGRGRIAIERRRKGVRCIKASACFSSASAR